MMPTREEWNAYLDELFRPKPFHQPPEWYVTSTQMREIEAIGSFEKWMAASQQERDAALTRRAGRG